THHPSIYSILSLFFFMTRPPPTSTLFPYTTLFRSDTIRGSYPRPPGRGFAPVQGKSTGRPKSLFSLPFLAFHGSISEPVPLSHCKGVSYAENSIPGTSAHGSAAAPDPSESTLPPPRRRNH